LDVGNQAALVALGHGHWSFRDQSYLGEQGNDLGGRGMSYLQPSKKQPAWRQGGRWIDA